jgi:hypothetical protein
MNQDPWNGRINWFDYYLRTEAHEAEMEARVDVWWKNNPPPKCPKEPRKAAHLLSDKQFAKRHKATQKWLEASERWAVEFRETYEAALLDYPPSLKECVLHVDSEGDVVAAISKNRDAELHFFR